eukprot:TRINITY_DN6746_c0_g1_i8.p1 TRINITY_DN6746_c0_g1~~TRINITY_DN6746_c0_g1_i8.p1  ORF type:complete len:114 (+),score=17.82 TRINITY_DN6746_c0_g1_i8:541-882(+)
MQVELLHVQKLPLLASAMTLCECAKYIVEVLKVAIRATVFFRHCKQSLDSSGTVSNQLRQGNIVPVDFPPAKGLRSLMPHFSFRSENSCVMESLLCLKELLRKRASCSKNNSS